MVLQAIELSADFELLDPIPYPSPQEAFFPRDQILYTANGVLRPQVSMYPGEVQRWRILNAAEGKFMALELEGHELHVVAWDGLTLAAPEPVSSVLIPAGGRVEVLIKAAGPGSYGLVLSPGSSQQPNIPGLMDDPQASHTPQHGPEQEVRPILTLEVSGRGPEMGLPASLPAFDPPMLPVIRQRTVTYTVERGSDLTFLDFGVDGAPFDPERPAYQIRLDTAEEWTVVNGVDDKLADHAHGFHIHVNPFLVTHINREPLDTPLWRDTFALRGHTGDSFTFVSNFTDFTGRFVDHCHVLSHEDLGMMEALEVVP
jgi:FtsP/CotA-like multicopper oxidase with cupredoxin domain